LQLEEVIKLGEQYELCLIPWELEKSLTLKEVLKGLPDSILLLIGPEGGFSRQEVDLAVKAGFKAVSLGKRILRSETAGLASLAAISYELEDK
ncbi:MAG: RNA methyltransferase, partial [Candidatus Margulisbacteria bacterium]|nr:RNA methyltransferase [Candidatus Margulisiibacteriota bacterium]